MTTLWKCYELLKRTSFVTKFGSSTLKNYMATLALYTKHSICIFMQNLNITQTILNVKISKCFNFNFILF